MRKIVEENMLKERERYTTQMMKITKRSKKISKNKVDLPKKK